MVLEEEIEVAECDDKPNISLNAITGSLSIGTMRIKGTINNQMVVVLVDSGSTYNFVEPAMVTNLKLLLNPFKKFRVTIVIGE